MEHIFVALAEPSVHVPSAKILFPKSLASLSLPEGGLHIWGRSVVGGFTATGSTPFSGWSKKTKKKLDAEMIELAREEKGKNFELKPWRIHDLRRTMVTGMAELGIRPDVIEQVVNHISGSRSGVAGTYN